MASPDALWRAQSMPHTVQTDSIFHIKCLGLHAITDTFCLTERAPHICNLIFPMHELWSDPQPLATASAQTSGILQGIPDVRSFWL